MLKIGSTAEEFLNLGVYILCEEFVVNVYALVKNVS